MNIALIPARSGSKRIPNKNMMDFCGKPLVQWSVEQAMTSKLIDEVVLSTDIEGYEPQAVTVVHRPASLCTDTTTQEEVIAHAINTLKLRDSDNIVLLQPTSPLRLPGDIDSCIENESISVNIEDDLFLWSEYHTPLSFNMRTREKKLAYRENGSIYFINAGHFRREGSRYYASGFQKFYRMKKWQQFEIDETEDIQIVEFFMNKYIFKKEGI